MQRKQSDQAEQAYS